MDFEDFLIEYDLTEAQLQLAKKLKAEANFRQLLNVLGDHALFFSRQYAKRQKPEKPEKEGRRSEVLGWFASLSVEERLAVLSCNEEGWVQAVLKMNSHVTAGGAQRQGHFKVTLKPAPNSRRQGGTSSTRPNREVKVHYRRPHRLPDGEVLAPPATTAFRQAATRLSRHLRVELRSTSVAIDWGAIVPSPGLLSDSQAFIGLMDEISLGRFLQEEPGKAQWTPWAEASWLGQWGSHFPLAAFLASRLEVLLFQGYASRLQDPVRPAILPLAEVWASMPQQQREISWARLGRCLLRRLLSETLASAFHDAGLALTLALVAAQDCETGTDASLAFVQLGQELVKAPKVPMPMAAPATQAPKVARKPLVHVPRNFGGLKKAGEAAEAEAISKGIQALARYIFDSLAYTMPVTQALKAVSRVQIPVEDVMLWRSLTDET
ncbi:unnamed protein product [Cladocopium goreaui]|uniref:Uncharacterized protein n=1 Tax=Cladocopium goreaui TaxID=2562237 RepID=A0A9P1GL39_9DINO|nr:unnamed protein product [Cladocopium goreaui]